MCLSLFPKCFFYWHGDPRDLHLLTHSFPTRRSSARPRSDGADCRRAGARDPRRRQGGDRRCAPVRPLRRPGRSRRSGEPGGRGRIAAAREEFHRRSEEHTSELQSLMRISYAVFCLKKKTNNQLYIQNKTTYIK